LALSRHWRSAGPDGLVRASPGAARVVGLLLRSRTSPGVAAMPGFVPGRGDERRASWRGGRAPRGVGSLRVAAMPSSISVEAAGAVQTVRASSSNSALEGGSSLPSALNRPRSGRSVSSQPEGSGEGRTVIAWSGRFRRGGCVSPASPWLMLWTGPSQIIRCRNPEGHKKGARASVSGSCRPRIDRQLGKARLRVRQSAL